MSIHAAWGQNLADADSASIMEWELGARVTNDMLNENTPWGRNVVKNRASRCPALPPEEEGINYYKYRWFTINDDDEAVYRGGGTVDDEGRLLSRRVVSKSEDDDTFWYIPIHMIEEWFDVPYWKGASK